ncbi:hypothetical protein AB3K78_10965 [Leucobacter sp. HNU]|uniref:hypothetical protein n=1 Tax=Leucobacter sp. HNU TaxID=3236805 RepID=UPI003A807A63
MSQQDSGHLALTGAGAPIAGGSALVILFAGFGGAALLFARRRASRADTARE